MTLYRTNDGKVYTVSEEGLMSHGGKKYYVSKFVPGNVGVSTHDGLVFFWRNASL